MIESWVDLVLSQSYGQILFILVGGLMTVAFIVALVFLATRAQKRKLVD